MAGKLTSEQARALAAKRKNPGRKPRAEESEIRAALHIAIDPAKVHKQLASAVKKGEQWAVALYMAYDWGKPRESVEVGGSDGGPVHFIIDE